jgi:hypothetical protein
MSNLSEPEVEISWQTWPDPRSPASRAERLTNSISPYGHIGYFGQKSVADCAKRKSANSCDGRGQPTRGTVWRARRLVRVPRTGVMTATGTTRKIATVAIEVEDGTSNLLRHAGGLAAIGVEGCARPRRLDSTTLFWLVPNGRRAHIYHVHGLDICFAVSSLMAIFVVLRPHALIIGRHCADIGANKTPVPRGPGSIAS